MSDVSQGPGWWLASDGKWYRPDQAPGYPSPGPPPTTDPGASAAIPGSMPAPGTYIPVSAPGPLGTPDPAAYPFPPTPAGTAAAPAAPAYGPPPGYGYGYGPSGPPYGYAPVRRTNGLAIASFVCSFFFFVYGLGAVLAIVFGFIARAQIKKSEGMQQGNGLALAGIIIGFAGIVMAGIVIALVVALVHHCDQSGSCTFNTTPNGGD
jgi:hypothetical protein